MRTASLLAATAAAALAAPAFAQFQLTADYDFYWYFGNPGSGNVGDQYLIINDASTTPGGVDDGQGGILPYELFRAVAVISFDLAPLSGPQDRVILNLEKYNASAGPGLTGPTDADPMILEAYAATTDIRGISYANLDAAIGGFVANAVIGNDGIYGLDVTDYVNGLIAEGATTAQFFLEGRNPRFDEPDANPHNAYFGGVGAVGYLAPTLADRVIPAPGGLALAAGAGLLAARRRRA